MITQEERLQSQLLTTNHILHAGAVPLQPLTALAIGCLLWMACSIGGRALRRYGLIAPVSEVCFFEVLPSGA